MRITTEILYSIFSVLEKPENVTLMQMETQWKELYVFWQIFSVCMDLPMNARIM